MTRSSRRGSRSSISGRKRDGSVASERRAAQGQGLPLGSVGQATNPASVATPPGVDRKNKGGISRLFSRLSCCGGTEDANAIDLDEHALPARKSTKLQTQATQTKTVKRLNTSAEDSSTTASKDMTDEKLGPPYSLLKSAGEPRIQESPKSTVSNNTTQLSQSITGEGENSNNPSPVVPPENVATSSVVTSREMPINAPTQAVVQSQGTSVLIVPPTPTTPDRASAIDDRTPSQVKRDSDTEMVDAPLEEPAVEENANGAERSEVAGVPPLPPPPPLVTRAESSIPGHERSLSNNANAPNEQQKWLLPPMKPEFRGKKCLVLDLDETLVHSSFKVSLCTTYFNSKG